MSDEEKRKEKREKERERERERNSGKKLTPLVLKVAQSHDQADPVGLGRCDHLVEPLQRRLVEHADARLDRVGRLGALVAAKAVEVGSDPDNARALVGLDAEEVRDVSLGEVGAVNEVDGVGATKVPGRASQGELGAGGFHKLGRDGLARFAGVGVVVAVGGLHLRDLHRRRLLLGLDLHRRGLRGHGHGGGRSRSSGGVFGSRDSAGDESGGGDERSGCDAAEDRGTLLFGGLGRRRDVDSSHGCCFFSSSVSRRKTRQRFFLFVPVGEKSKQEEEVRRRN